MPDTTPLREAVHPLETAKRLLRTPRWREGVVAQALYVAAQITCWTYVIHYALENVSGMTLDMAQWYAATRFHGDPQPPTPQACACKGMAWE